MEPILNRPAHKGYPGKVYIKTVGDFGICDPTYWPPTKQEAELAEEVYNWYTKEFSNYNWNLEE